MPEKTAVKQRAKIKKKQKGHSGSEGKEQQNREKKNLQYKNVEVLLKIVIEIILKKI